MSQSPATILLGYDFSDTASEAAQVAFSIAALTGAGVRAVLVVERRYERRIAELGHLLSGGQADASQESAPERVTRIVMGRLEAELRPRCSADVSLEVEVARGKPFKELLRAAEASQAGLIVIGGTGMSQADRWVLGSTAERLARRSVIPTFVVRRGSTWEPRRILCPVDYSDAARLALEKALWLARLTGASLQVLNVVAGTEADELETLGLLNRSDVKRYFEVSRELANQRMDQFLKDVDLEGLRVEREITHGRPHAKIGQHAVEMEADLIVIGGLGQNAIAELLIGSTTERVLRKMPCSVLTVKPERG